MLKVKICGLTNLADAQTAADAGADYLGFIFYARSKRAATAAEVAGIVRHLRAAGPAPLFVGVFVNETAADMAAILAACDLDLAQLSGEEPPALVGDPASPLYGRAYKAIRPTSMAEAEADAEWFVAPPFVEQLPGLLLDTYHPTLHGGTGETADWAMAARLSQSAPRLMLAGGLKASNVARAVATARPWAVDVASGVEAFPGKKDPGQVRAFVAAARGARLS